MCMMLKSILESDDLISFMSLPVQYNTELVYAFNPLESKNE